jgi:hypothetical protein
MPQQQIAMFGLSILSKVEEDYAERKKTLLEDKLEVNTNGGHFDAVCP